MSGEHQPHSDLPPVHYWLAAAPARPYGTTLVMLSLSVMIGRPLPPRISPLHERAPAPSFAELLER